MRNLSSVWIGVLALEAAACSTYDCEEGCRRDPPVCEEHAGLDCRGICQSYLGTEDCVAEGERVLECFEEHAGTCNNGCDPDEPAPDCVPGCEDALRAHMRCKDPLFGSLDGHSTPVGWPPSAET
jgi:hypothetical protein